MFQDISPAEALHRRVVHAEQRLEVLRELTELGMALARDLTRRALAAPERPEAAPEAAPAPRRDPADAFARLSRAIRLTLALEAKAEDQLSALRSGGIGPAGDATPRALYQHQPFPPDLPCPKRNRIRNAVFDIVDREVTGDEREDRDKAIDILETTHDWLAEGEEFGAFVQLPLKAAVEAVFRYFKMQPDLSCWTEDGPPASVRTPRQIWERFWPPPGEPRLE